MRYRELAKTGFRASVVGMGTYYDFGWIFAASVFRKRLNEGMILESLQTGLDGGINLIDTAEIYASEPIVAKALEGRDRESVFIASKVFPTHFRREKLIRSCARSLKRLKTDYIDLYQLHFPNFRVPIEETMGAMEELVDRGMIRHIGISNFSFKSMLEAERALKKYRLTSTQMHYNVSHRQVEYDILPHCEREGIALLPYYPIGHGRLSREDGKAPAVFGSLAGKHGLRSNAQVALTYLVSRSECIFPIPRARTPDHVMENTEVGGSLFDSDELASLQSAFPSQGNQASDGEPGTQ